MNKLVVNVDADREVFVAKPYRPLIGRRRRPLFRLRLSRSKSVMEHDVVPYGRPSGVYMRSILRRIFVAVVDLDDGVFFLDLGRKQEIRIDESDVELIVAGGVFRVFTIVSLGNVVYRRSYVDLSGLFGGMFFDQLEEAELDFFKATQNEKMGGFVNMRAYLSASA